MTGVAPQHQLFKTITLTGFYMRGWCTYSKSTLETVQKKATALAVAWTPVQTNRCRSVHLEVEFLSCQDLACILSAPVLHHGRPHRRVKDTGTGQNGHLFDDPILD